MPHRQNGRRKPAGDLRRGGPRRLLTVTAVGLAVLLGSSVTGAAVPPPPPNPSDSEINSSRDAAAARAGEVGQLTNQLAEAESKLVDLQASVELKMEQANKALVDMRTAQDAASQAAGAAEAARAESEAANGAIASAHAQVDKFIAGSYQQGSKIGSMSAYMDSRSPKDMLARSQLLDAVGGSQLDALDNMRQAQVAKANKDAAARQSLQIAQQKQSEAERAKGAADAARAAAVQAQQSQASRTAELQTHKAGVERHLYDAQATVTGLRGQRQRYEDWQAQKQAEDAAQARHAALSNSASSGESSGSTDTDTQAPASPAASSVESVVARAKSQLGLPYAWGGGNSRGPTKGIRDGGVADRYGDYRKTGFDCSGLMIYAFAGVKSLSHYSGYQYNSGKHVSLSKMRRGDMIFYGGSGGIHHVALYLGNGQMIEAPQSGSVVKISSVRYGGIMPYATRLTS